MITKVASSIHESAEETKLKTLVSPLRVSVLRSEGNRSTQVDLGSALLVTSSWLLCRVADDNPT